MKKYDVIVVGAGHAGCEAALISAKLGAKVLMFVIKFESIGRMSCNPSVGGPAKGHLAREVDALGGAIGKVADLTGIHFRMLNRSKGPAVWAPRTQNDRLLYSIEMKNICEAQEGLDIIESTITEIIVKKNKIIGVKSILGHDYFARRVILTTGTFLDGLIHVGDISYSGGRSGEPASFALSGSLVKNGFKIARFKTGTPPRIDLNSLDFSKIKEQHGDDNPTGFSFYRGIKLKNKISCYITYTNTTTHKIISENLIHSSLYSGKIGGTGPRYCPSVEDKVVKFPKKDRHQVFIEPEGLHTNECYVNGMSNSLPPYVQEKFIHSIAGMEKAKFIRYAYAIEYDYLPPLQLDFTLQSKKVEGLYLAGQINGTSGYEEAAAQGLVAGINATLMLGKRDSILFERSKSYIGVLIDDLTLKGTEEPYRMFTSRCEYRLCLRQDNADQRLMPLAHKLGTVSKKRYDKFLEFENTYKRELSIINSTKSTKHPKLKEPKKLSEILKRPDVKFEDLSEYGYLQPSNLDERIKQRVTLQIKYKGYLNRQKAEIERFEDAEHKKIPKGIDYKKIETIRFEAREKLHKIKPLSIGQANRISGVNPSDITALLIYLKKIGFR